MSYNIENLSFTIFGNGHDYTLLDSGDGDTQVFSHPFVPLNSVMYAGQWYFIVPDENGELIDPIKDDLAHCTFTPALGDTFDTEGEIEVKCHYHREYVYPESTIVVDKEVKQTIEVVDHGNVVRQAGVYGGKYYGSDIYDDGYCFMHPQNVNDLANVSMCVPWGDNSIKKISSLWWRITQIGYTEFIRSTALEDISELKYADVSNVTIIKTLITDAVAEIDLSPIGGWDTSNVEEFHLLNTCRGIKTLKGIEKLNTSKVKNISQFVTTCQSLVDISALYELDFSEVVNMYGFLSNNTALADLTGLDGINPEKVENLDSAFAYDSAIKNVDALIGWTCKPKTTKSMLQNCTALMNFGGLANFDMSENEDASEMFSGDGKLTNLHGGESWVFSMLKTASKMFNGCVWISDISASANWGMSACESFGQMYLGNAMITDLSPISGWNVSSAVEPYALMGMFSGFRSYYSEAIGKDVWVNNMSHYFDYDGNQYVYVTVQPTIEYVKDASGVANWDVQTTPALAFGDGWTNIPAWN